MLTYGSAGMPGMPYSVPSYHQPSYPGQQQPFSGAPGGSFMWYAHQSMYSGLYLWFSALIRFLKVSDCRTTLHCSPFLFFLYLIKTIINIFILLWCIFHFVSCSLVLCRWSLCPAHFVAYGNFASPLVVAAVMRARSSSVTSLCNIRTRKGRLLRSLQWLQFCVTFTGCIIRYVSFASTRWRQMRLITKLIVTFATYFIAITRFFIRDMSDASDYWDRSGISLDRNNNERLDRQPRLVHNTSKHVNEGFFGVSGIKDLLSW